MKPINEDTVLAALARHIGEAKGVTARELVVEITGRPDSELQVRDLRHVIEHLRRGGHHICAHPGAGYYMAANTAELDRTCMFLYDRAMTTLMQISRMKNVALPDIRGQMKLPT